MKKKPSRRVEKKIKILVIHGPNLNLLGTREPGIYGKTSLSAINQLIRDRAKQLNVEIRAVQSNHEGELIDMIGKAVKTFQGVLINPAAYTHTSVALRDALLACGIPAVEIHLSNIYNREEFRRESLTAPACIGMVAGFRENSYLLALEGLVQTILLSSKK